MRLVTVTRLNGLPVVINPQYVIAVEPSLHRGGSSYMILAHKDDAILLKHTPEELIEILNGDKP